MQERESQDNNILYEAHFDKSHCTMLNVTTTVRLKRNLRTGHEKTNGTNGKICP